MLEMLESTSLAVTASKVSLSVGKRGVTLEALAEDSWEAVGFGVDKYSR